MNKTLIIMTTFASSVASAALTAGTTASLIFYEGFDYGALSDGDELTSQNGGTGFSGAWEPGVTTSQNPSGVLTYSTAGLDSGLIAQYPAIGGAVEDSASNAVLGSERSFDAIDVSGDGELWFSFLMEQNGGGEGWFHLGTGMSYRNEMGLKTNASNSFLASLEGSNGTNATSGTFQLNTTYFVVGRLTHSSTGTESLEYWLNPISATLGAPVTSITKEVSGMTINRLLLHSFRTARFTYDEIRVGLNQVDVMRTVGFPAVPNGLTATALTPYSIELQWVDQADNEIGYRIERGSVGGAFSTIDEIAANSTSYIDSMAAPGIELIYRITPVTAEGTAGSTTVSVTTPGSSDRMNVLFLLIDDLKPSLGVYGDPLAQTPNIDTLASQGRTFKRHFVQVAQCQQSRNSMYSGLRPDTIKVHRLSDNLLDKAPGTKMMAQHFSNYGYRTSGLGKVLHSNNYASLNYNEGYIHHGVQKRFFETSPIDKSGQEDTFLGGGGQAYAFQPYATDRAADNDCSSGNSEGFIGDLYQDGQTTVKAMNQLADLSSNFDSNSNEPFFIAIGINKPHTPFNAPESYWALYDSLTNEEFGFPATWNGVVTPPVNAIPEIFGNAGIGFYDEFDDTGGITDPADGRILKQGYYACVSWVDDLVGRILDKLTELGRDEDTIVVLWGDHGYHLGDYGGRWEKHDVTEVGTYAPLIIRVPQMSQPGVASDALVESIDIFPTLCNLTGIPHPIQPGNVALEGSSLEPLLDDPYAPFKKIAVSQYPREFDDTPDNGDSTKTMFMRYTYRSEKFRYVVWYKRPNLDDVSTMESSIWYEELYDHAQDPSQMTNYAADPAYASIIAEFRAIAAEGKAWEDPLIAPRDPSLAEDFAAWADIYAPFVSDQWAPSDRFDSDPMPVLVQYLLGANPRVSNDAAMTLTLGASGEFILGFPTPVLRSDYNLVAMGSSDLSANSWSSAGLVMNASSTPGQSEVLLPDVPQFFIRLDGEPVP